MFGGSDRGKLTSKGSNSPLCHAMSSLLGFDVIVTIGVCTIIMALTEASP